jgi:putative two-component system response regulator
VSPHILLAEDHPYTIDMMRELLEAEGYRVTCAQDGSEALAAFEHDAPDLIVSDLLMPHMDGFALLKAVRSHPYGAAVPFLFLSARAEQSVTAQARVLGADDYLVKPFAPADLSLAVRAKLERRKAIRRFDTREAHQQTALMLANVIESRDRYTRGHIERVERYAVRVARALEWDVERITLLEFGALLHDIGKILAPRRILNKPDKLTEAEWIIMRRHPENGAQMLTGVEHLRETLPYVLYHHERWDGKGYPTGLAGRSIPVEARLLAIADAYDAMTNDRPYRAAVPIAKALDEIQRCSGTQFDPELVNVFIYLFKTH